MSDSTKGSGAPADKGGAQTGTDNNEKKISAEDLDRALKDLHKYKALAKDYETKLQETENGKLLAEGKKDELIASLQKSVTELKSKNGEMQKNFAWDKVKGWLKTKAVTGGIVDGGAAEKFVQLIDFKGRNPFRDDQTFTLEETVLGQVFEDAKKEMPYFFAKSSVNVRDTNPQGSSNEPNGEKDFSKLSLDQMREQARKLSITQ